MKDLGLLTGPATAIIAWLMFGVYQIGYTIEDPFKSSLRLSILCDAIKSDIIGASEDEIETRQSAYCADENIKISNLEDSHDFPIPITIHPKSSLVLNKTLMN